MKRLIPFLLFLVACAGESEEAKDEVIIIEDTLKVADTMPEFEFVDIDPIPSSVNLDLMILMNDPIDLVAFKKEWGPSNGGGGGYTGMLDEPDTIGSVYRFFLFHKLRSIVPGRPSEGEIAQNFELAVYRYGEHIGDFYDTNEELLMIRCAMDNPALNELNWYGKSKIQLMDKYGAPQYEQDECLIYSFNNKTITAHLTNDQVDWYKYVKLNKDLDLEKEIPGILLDF